MEDLRLRDNDRDLVEKALGGDERSFRKILEEHYALIYSVVRGILGSASEGEDVVQEVLIKIFRALPAFRGEARLSTWIYRIARNDLAARGDDPGTAHRKLITRERLERLMERLDEPQRVALELRYIGEKSYEEIAEIMDIPLGTVKTYIYRAKISLKRMMMRTEAKPLEKGFSKS
jgi:RNA polymerase sigma-70 factor (ECF subfamily)